MKMNDDREDDELDGPSKKEHDLLHEQLHEGLLTILKDAHDAGLGAHCLIMELFAMSVAVDLDNAKDKDAFLEAASNIYDETQKVRESHAN